jgi:CHAT domain-containing protein
MEQNQAEPNDVYNLGGMLWQAIFGSTGIERRYVACQAEAGTQKGIRIKLTIESPDLMNLPWEYLYDPESQTFPALSPRTPITRYTNPKQQDPPPLAFDPPLRILLVSASPEEQPRLDVEAERDQIIQAMELLEATGKVEIETLTNATVRNLQVMLRRPFHVLHYIGHGTYDEQTNSGMLALEHKDGSQHAVSAAQLQYLLRDTTIRLAVFNACMTARGAAGRSIAGELMRAGISATLAMQFAISETSARIFAGEFYRTLADGWPVDAAAAEGRKAVMFATDLTNMDWGIPVLFMRTRDGILFQHGHETSS